MLGSNVDKIAIPIIVFVILTTLLSLIAYWRGKRVDPKKSFLKEYNENKKQIKRELKKRRIDDIIADFDRDDSGSEHGDH